MDADELHITDFNSEKEKSQQSLLMVCSYLILALVYYVKIDCS